MAKDRRQKAGNLRFQVKLFVLLWDLASHWVSKCVASFIVAAEKKREERAAISWGGQSHNPKDDRPWKELWLCCPGGQEDAGKWSQGEMKPSHLSLVYC